MATNNHKDKDTASDIVLPSWLNAQLFEPLLRSQLKDFKQTKSFAAEAATTAGENYMTIMLSLKLEVELNDGTTKMMSFMIKLPQTGKQFEEWMSKHNFFEVETLMYNDVVHEFEQMYTAAGQQLKFCAQHYKVATPNEYDIILLENLRVRNFKNINRLNGLDLTHTKAVLKKLAEWHAASATRVALKGEYPPQIAYGYLREDFKETTYDMNKGFYKIFMQCLTQYEGHQSYAAAVEKLHTHITDELYNVAKVKPDEFNVLNHGDCWSNNIMFQYDNAGNILETYFIDYQIPKYGTPAQDLYYLILSSVSYELKLQHFDYFIRYYYEHLRENLMLLKYPKKIPTLRDIHMDLCKYNIWGFVSATGIMAAVLLEPTKNANLENFVSDTEAGTAFKKLMFTNDRYRKHIEAILPWLHNRGALEYTST